MLRNFLSHQSLGALLSRTGGCNIVSLVCIVACCRITLGVETYLCERRATAALCKVVQGLSRLQLVRACFIVWVKRQFKAKGHQALGLKCAGRAAWASAWLQAVRTKKSAADVGLKVYKPTTPGEHSLSNLNWPSAGNHEHNNRSNSGDVQCDHQSA